jgi:uncharacterized protein YodC (DUF2158 family)
MTKWKSEDIVRLKSGGPIMTVAGYAGITNSVSCKWFVGSKAESEIFNEDSLVAAQVEKDED